MLQFCSCSSARDSQCQLYTIKVSLASDFLKFALHCHAWSTKVSKVGEYGVITAHDNLQYLHHHTQQPTQSWLALGIEWHTPLLSTTYLNCSYMYQTYTCIYMALPQRGPTGWYGLTKRKVMADMASPQHMIWPHHNKNRSSYHDMALYHHFLQATVTAWIFCLQ